MIEAIEKAGDRPTLLRLPEFVGVMRNMKSKATATLVQLLLELHDHPAVIANHTLSKPLEVVNPAASILADATPEPLTAELADGDISSGLISRCTFWTGERGEPLPYPPSPDPARLAELQNTVRRLADYTAPARHFEPKPDALEFWADVYRAEVFQRQDEHAASARLGDQAWQLAAVYAFSDNGRHVITLDDIKRGWALSDWLARVRLGLVQDIGRSDRAKLLDRLEAIVADHPAGIPTGRTRTMLSQPQRNTAADLGGVGKQSDEPAGSPEGDRADVPGSGDRGCRLLRGFLRAPGPVRGV